MSGSFLMFVIQMYKSSIQEGVGYHVPCLWREGGYIFVTVPMIRSSSSLFISYMDTFLQLTVAWHTYQCFMPLAKLVPVFLGPRQFLAQWPSCPHLKQAPDLPAPPPRPLPDQLFCGTNSPRDFIICFHALLLCADPLIPPPRRR